MKMPYGKYKGQDMSTLPHDYLSWIVENFDDGPIKVEAEKILSGPDVDLDKKSKSLEEQANDILGEKPIGLLRRGKGRPRRR